MLLGWPTFNFWLKAWAEYQLHESKFLHVHDDNQRWLEQHLYGRGNAFCMTLVTYITLYLDFLYA